MGDRCGSNHALAGGSPFLKGDFEVFPLIPSFFKGGLGGILLAP